MDSLLNSIFYLDPQSLKKSYYVHMLAFWMPFVEISRMVMRYGKIALPLYLNIHSIMMTMTSLYTIMYVALYYGLFGLEVYSLVTLIQTISSLSLLLLLIVQMALGVFGRVTIFAFWHLTGSETVRAVHKWLGYAIILFTRLIISLVFIRTAVQTEETVSQTNLKGWFFTLGGFYVVLLILEFLYRLVLPVFIMRDIESRKDIDLEFQEQSSYNSIVQLINQGVPTQQILNKYPDSKFVIVNNRVYEIEDFVHPGGDNIIYEVLGEEINYLLTGGHSTKANPLKHTHSAYVWRYLKNKRSTKLKVRTLVEKIDFLSEDQKLFKIVSVSPFGESSTALFEFKSDFAHIRNMYEDISQLGKYFMVEMLTQNPNTVVRPYSVLLWATPENTAHRILLLSIYNDRKQASSYLGDTSYNQFSTVVPFIVKCYPEGSMSNNIKNIPNANYKIQGPFGKGLDLDQELKGKLVIITGGTGILPFLDLFDLMLKNLLLQMIARDFGSVRAQKLNQSNVKFEMVKGLRVELYACFRTAQQFYGREIVTELHSLSNSLNLDLFHMQLRLSKDRFYQSGLKVGRDYITRNVMQDIIKSAPKRLYLSGTPQMNEQIAEIYFDQGGDRSKLHVL